MSAAPLAPFRSGARALLLALLVATTSFVATARAHGTLHDTIERVQSALPPTDPSGGGDAAQALLERGELKRLAGDFKGAHADFDASANLKPERPALLFCRGALALDEGDPASAERLVARGLELEPGTPPAWVLRATIRSRRGDGRGAIADYDRALETTWASGRRAPADWILERGRLVRGLDGDEAALAGLERALARDGEHPVLLLKTIDAERSLGRTDAALERLERFERALPNEAPRTSTLALRGDLLREAGRSLEADAAYTEALATASALPEARRSPAMRALVTRLEARLSGRVSAR